MGKLVALYSAAVRGVSSSPTQASAGLREARLRAVSPDIAGDGLRVDVAQTPLFMASAGNFDAEARSRGERLHRSGPGEVDKLTRRFTGAGDRSAGYPLKILPTGRIRRFRGGDTITLCLRAHAHLAPIRVRRRGSLRAARRITAIASLLASRS